LWRIRLSVFIRICLSAGGWRLAAGTLIALAYVLLSTRGRASLLSDDQ